ncbi:TolC family outer membrane protein [Oxalobacteraceae bacterium]|nr:TolC family outer membrane protein [Oxalobacteraceae bacterium]
MKQGVLAGLLAQLLGGAALLHGASAGATGLVQAYEAALHNDPTYRAAFYDSESGKEYRALGRSGLLPQLSASYSANKNRSDLTVKPLPTTHPEYISRSRGVQLRQTLFNLDALARYKQGQAQSQYSEAVFSNQGQELVLRLAGAYFDAAVNSEQVALAQAQRDAQLEQKKLNERLFAKGEGTRTDVLETQARLDLTEAQLIEAQDNQRTALATLEAIVGEPVTSLDELGASFQVRPLQPSGYEQWQELALKNNPELQAQQFSIEASRQEINKNRAGHAPRLDFVASYNKGSAETLNTYTQDSVSRSIGVQLNIPLYSGGSVNAATRQASAAYEKARSEMDAKTSKVLIELRKQYNLALSSAARINALDKAVASAELLIKATEQSIKGGVRINADLLNAQQQLFVSKRDRAQARYGYLHAQLRLRAAAGSLAADDVVEVASYFR